MNTIHNPYEILINQVSELKKIVLEIKNAPKEDYSIKYYKKKEVAALMSVSTQTLDNYEEKGWIKYETFGPKKQLIHHYEIFNEDNTIKNFKYKR